MLGTRGQALVREKGRSDEWPKAKVGAVVHHVVRTCSWYAVPAFWHVTEYHTMSGKEEEPAYGQCSTAITATRTARVGRSNALIMMAATSVMAPIAMCYDVDAHAT